MLFFLQLFFFKLLLKFSDFINSDDGIRKITSKSNRLQPVFVLKRFEANKKTDFHIKKKRETQVIRSFLGEDFKSNALYWYKIYAHKILSSWIRNKFVNMYIYIYYILSRKGTVYTYIYIYV